MKNLKLNKNRYIFGFKIKFIIKNDIFFNFS